MSRKAWEAVARMAREIADAIAQGEPCDDAKARQIARVADEQIHMIDGGLAE